MKKGDNALLPALAAGASIREAAEAAGVGERTATRRLADPAFRRRVQKLRGAMLERALGNLADASAEAVATLRALLKAEAETVQLGAARAILEAVGRVRESVEFAERLAKLEEAVRP